MSQEVLRGAVSIVTGGGSGIGKAIARGLSEAGASVTITGRSPERLQKAAQEIGQGVRTVAADVASEPDVQRLFEDVLGAHDGRLDLLVNSAGAFGGARIDELEIDVWRHVLDVNVTGAFLCTREAFRAMRERGLGGRIINIGSTSGARARHHSAAYTTSKHALVGLTACTALDGREFGIVASCLNPGNTDVERRRDGRPKADRDGGVEPLMDAQDVADVALLMASLPRDVNLLDATILPVDQLYLGRG
jgi:NAD(P)-dependent dehydrogenase (short-subunit alcohol dehydrogenase family)